MIRAGTLAIAVLAACTTTAPPLSIDGQPVADTVWAVAPTSVNPGSTGQGAFVVMSTRSGLCDRAASNTALPGEKTISIEMVDIVGISTTAPSGPGEYIVPIESELYPKTGWVAEDSFDAHCTHSGLWAARAGTITVAKIAGNALTASFDVSLDRNGTEQVSGTFTATSCPGLVNALQHTLPSCTPI